MPRSRTPRDSSPLSSRPSRGGPGGGRRIGSQRPYHGGRGPGGNWSGSSHWSVYGRRDKLWPKVLLVLAVVGVLMFGTILVADRLTGLDVGERIAGTDDGATATSTGSGAGTPEGTVPSGATGATPGASPVTAISSPTATPEDLSKVKTAKDTAEAYARVWTSGNFDQLYDLLSSAAKGRISREDFVARYEAIGVEAGIITVSAKIVSGSDDDEMFPMKVTIASSRVGEIKDDNLLPLVKEGDRYGVDWSPNLIFSQLGDGYVRWESDVPQRGRILDRKGRPLAEMGKLTRVGVVPGKVENEADMLQKLSAILDMPVDTIKARISGGQADWFMPVRDLPNDVDQAILDKLGAIPGVAVQKAPARVYPAGPVAAHVVGYMSEITAEELPELAKQGYESGDMIGRTGVESWGEKWLAGKRGGALKLIRQDGTTIRVLGEVAAEPAKDIVLTLDLDIQQAAYDALGDEAGADVVLDPNNGEVLAMVSKPSYDPNWFILGITDEQWAQLNDANKTPLVNRATAFATSTGSIFKVITAAAGMKDLGYTADTIIPCPGEFMLDGSSQVWHDWIPGGQGDLTLHNGIVRSCNTVFYRIGAELDKKGENLLPDMAKAFGLGKLTGLPELFEIPGIVPDPEWKMANVGDFWARGDAVNLAIGQGYLTATPLQMANVYAALANGGTLYQPHLTLDIVNLDGSIAQKGEVKEIGKLPITADQIAAIRSALYDVINASNGTAVTPFVGINHDVSGKTGTEQTGEQGEGTNAWFAAYTPSNAPKMTTIVFVAKGVAGSQSAAPVARKIIDRWFEVYPE